MKVAVYSDIHGDLDALRVAHATAERLGCAAHLCCGDFVDEGRPAAEVIAFLIEMGMSCVRGNHERWLLSALRKGRYDHPLPRAAIAFLEDLPTQLDLELAGVRVAVHHARPGSDMEGLWEDSLGMADVRGVLAEADCDVLLVGHTHHAFVAHHPGGGLVANPGALGRPPFVRVGPVALISRSGASRVLAEGSSASGSFGVLDLPERRFRIIKE